ncbi:MAG: hypothetical protein ACRC9R_00130 [Enterovibrio sp.]
MKNIMLPIAATFIAAVSLPIAFAQSDTHCQTESATNPKDGTLNFRFKEFSKYNLSRYALFYYDNFEDKWRKATEIKRSANSNNADSNSAQKSRGKPGGEHDWIIANGIKPSYYNPAFTGDTILRFAVREEYNNQDEEYKKDLPLWICGDVKFSGNYEFVFYEKGQDNYSGCATNVY